ncbi:MAG: hypothetical protein M1834_000857 [Cirrosporium novae-zelandiae]|nr:MAG: hypothetical protein M1834_000857 [Cirrosporium novae-zelandiae]
MGNQDQDQVQSLVDSVLDDNLQVIGHRANVATIVSVVYVTASATFTGAIAGYTTLGDDDDDTTTATATKNSHHKTQHTADRATTTTETSEAQTTEASTTTAKETKEKTTTTEASITSSSTSSAKSTSISSSSFSSTVASTTLVTSTSASIAASSTSAAASATSTSSASSSGSSGGSKAGIAFGVIFALLAVAGLVFFVYKKKKQQNELMELDDEKTHTDNNAPPMTQITRTGTGLGLEAATREAATREAATRAAGTGAYAGAHAGAHAGSLADGSNLGAVATAVPVVSIARSGSERSIKRASVAPQLQLRPITQFQPLLAQDKPSGSAPQLSINTATSKALTDKPLPSSASSDPFTDPVDPFGNHAEAPSPNKSTAPPLARLSSIQPPASLIPGNPNTGAAADAAATGVAGAMVAGAVVAATASAAPNRKDVPNAPVLQNSAQQGPPAATSEQPAPGPAGSQVPVAMAPGAVGTPPNNVYRVQLDFKPSMDDELELHAGQVVRMLHEYDDGWALCIRMDRSQQGVAPRTCLSTSPVKPRPANPPRGSPPGARGPPINPNGRPMSPAGFPPSPASFPRPGSSRPATPTNQQRPMSPAGRPGQPRPMSPAGQRRPMSPAGQMRPMSPAGQRRPGPPPNMRGPHAPRSMSPGPYGGGPQPQPPRIPRESRRRSNSASAVRERRNSPPGPSPLANTQLNPNNKPRASVMPIDPSLNQAAIAMQPRPPPSAQLPATPSGPVPPEPTQAPKHAPSSSQSSQINRKPIPGQAL